MSSIAGAVVSIAREEPAGWLDIDTGFGARDDFLYGLGTGIAPPLWFLMLFVASMWAATRGGRARRLGVVGLTLAGSAIVIGTLGEPITYRALSASGVGSAESVIVAANFALGAALLVMGVRVWLAERVAPNNENVF
ncbi:MAG: hypothetical protein ACRDKG_13795 [Actinomycetota bacterium]